MCNGGGRCAMGEVGVQWDRWVCNGGGRCAVGQVGVQWGR